MIRSTLLLIPMLAILAIAASGCGRGDTIYGGDGNGTTIKETGLVPITIDDGRILPRGFFDQSVNRAVVDIYRNDSGTPFLELRLSAGTNTVGGFNGSDIGNRALAGISLYDTTLVSSFPGVTFDAKSDSLLADVLLIVDLDCTGTSVPRLLKAAGSDLFASSTVLEGGYRRYDASTTLPVWTSNIDVTDPADASVVLLSTTTTASLSDLVSKYPNACIKNTASLDPDMPKSLPTAGVLLSLGGGNTTLSSQVLVDQIVIGTDVYKVWEHE